jgi:[NiFe] hydrogenase assembly HybE family chaperone
MITNPDAPAAIPRVTAMVERFRTIGKAAMRDLPLYHADLAVEAVGFRLLDGHWVGVLITPWFMNLIRLPQRPEPMDMARIGRTVRVALPCGERELVRGGDESIGGYESLSLHSPMLAFPGQEAARDEAKRRLADLLRPEHSERESGRIDDGRLHAESGAQKMSRRAFFRCAT